MSVSAIAGAGVLAMLPSAPIDPHDDARPALFSILDGTGRRPLPCNQQLWVNSDRGCQTWTVPHPEVEGVLSEKTDAITTSAPTESPEAGQRGANAPMPAQSPVPPPVVAKHDRVTVQSTAQRDESPLDRVAESVASADTRVVGGETVAEVQARALPVPEDKAKKVTHRTDGPHNIPVASRSADGARRVIMIRPTSRQDLLYYSALRLH